MWWMSRRSRSAPVFSPFLFTFFAAALASIGGCDCGGTAETQCVSSTECATGETCVDGVCTPEADGSTRDGAPDGTPRVDAGPTTFVIDPADPVIDADGTPTSVTLSALLDGVAVPEAAWLVDDVVIGTIGSGGVYTANGLVAGVATVTARYGDLEATTTVTVHVNASVNSAGLSTADMDALRAGGTDDAAFELLYPYDATVFPRGLPSPLFQLAGGGADAARIKVDIERVDFHYEVFVAGGTPLQVALPEDAWAGAASSAGATDDVAVGVTQDPRRRGHRAGNRDAPHRARPDRRQHLLQLVQLASRERGRDPSSAARRNGRGRPGRVHGVPLRQRAGQSDRDRAQLERQR